MDLCHGLLGSRFLALSGELNSNEDDEDVEDRGSGLLTSVDSSHGTFSTGVHHGQRCSDGGNKG